MDGTNILDYFGIDPFYIMLGQAVLTIITFDCCDVVFLKSRDFTEAMIIL